MPLPPAVERARECAQFEIFKWLVETVIWHKALQIHLSLSRVALGRLWQDGCTWSTTRSSGALWPYEYTILQYINVPHPLT
jgi:hypothetical protein